MNPVQIGFALLLSPVFVVMLGILIWAYFDHRKARREWKANADAMTRRWGMPGWTGYK